MPRRPNRRASLLAIALLPVVATIAAAQQAPRDTVRRDTLLHPPDSYYLLPVLAGALVMALAAPPSLLLLPIPDSGATHASPSFLAGAPVFVYGGIGAGGDADDRNLWGWTGGVSVLHRGLYAEASVEQLRMHEENLTLRSARVGYLVSTRRSAMWGVTVGARGTNDPDAMHGMELGLPLVIGFTRGDIWLEPTYVVSSQAASWNYRLQGDLAITGTPLVAGMRFTTETLTPHGRPWNAAGWAILGVRL